MAQEGMKNLKEIHFESDRDINVLPAVEWANSQVYFNLVQRSSREISLLKNSQEEKDEPEEVVPQTGEPSPANEFFSSCLGGMGVFAYL
jgi:hypothetical protein